MKDKQTGLGATLPVKRRAESSSAGLELVEVLTPVAASRLFARSPEAVRTASRKGLVRTELVIDVETRPVRLVTLESALKYWDVGRSRDFESQLDHMRRHSAVLSVSGGTYRVLHPWSPVEAHPVCPHQSDWPCKKPPCSTTWFKEGRA